MRIDPKHFNKFIALCAALTLIVIIYSTIRYSQKQSADFQNRIEKVDFKSLTFYSYSESDSLKLSDLENRPVIIHFWSTWSDKSMDINQFLNDYSTRDEDIYVIAASVRDNESQIMEYIDSNRYPIHFVEGTQFYQSLLVPGMPTQILLNRNGTLHSKHIGDDIEALQHLLNSLM
jgi:thiol-disulfide isomerase/thioredoxin